ncbi:MAG: response regulator [Phycisphaerae bacterium]|nr:response regulator [Phycisphaerae bacterium]
MSKKILVVDDEAHILHVVSLKLRNAGFGVLTAADGEEALEVMNSDRPDLLITDYHMPVMNGVELCCRMRENDAIKDIPAIMLTARGYALEPEDMQRTGIRAVLSKPFSPRELLATVREIFGLAEAASPDEAVA